MPTTCCPCSNRYRLPRESSASWRPDEHIWPDVPGSTIGHRSDCGLLIGQTFATGCQCLGTITPFCNRCASRWPAPKSKGVSRVSSPRRSRCVWVVASSSRYVFRCGRRSVMQATAGMALVYGAAGVCHRLGSQLSLALDVFQPFCLHLLRRFARECLDTR